MSSNLIDYVFNTEKSNPDAKVTKIKTGGFNEYLRLCTAQEGKKKQQTIQDTITSNVGKTIEGKYVATFSNHYFLITSNGLRILLPKTMSEKELLEGDKAKVEIVFVDKKYNTLYATQKKSVDYAKIMQMPLLNNGDVIEISRVRHGRWEWFKNGWICDNCDGWNNRVTKFCPHCGAKMDRGDGNSDMA